MCGASICFDELQPVTKRRWHIFSIRVWYCMALMPRSVSNYRTFWFFQIRSFFYALRCIYYVYIVKAMFLENPKHLTIWNGGNTRYLVLLFQIVVCFRSIFFLTLTKFVENALKSMTISTMESVFTVHYLVLEYQYYQCIAGAACVIPIGDSCTEPAYQLSQCL